METCDNRINQPTNNRTLLKQTLLGFKRLSTELRRNKTGSRLNNLSLYILLTLMDEAPLNRFQIMQLLNSNYKDIEQALQQLTGLRLITSEYMCGNRFGKQFNVTTKKFRMSAKGECFITDLLNKLD